ncbi:MAG: guanylate kinase [Deltaproteobacteria bacterium]|nr:guanylate kinase [Deltaproteobacteria bacterium]
MSNSARNVRRGLPIVVSAASGTGKTSLCRALLKTLSNVSSSISYTTREPRGEEVHGREYYFVDDATFDRMIGAREFVEWAEVFGRRYGTAFHTVEEQLDAGTDVLLDIDVQGGAQIRDRVAGAVLIFLLPPSMDELRRRLTNRAEDSPCDIERRLAEAKEEILASAPYDYLLINDDFDEALSTLRSVIRAERLRRSRPSDLVQRLLSS